MAPRSAEDVEKFLRAHGPGTLSRLWFCLAYATHGRIGDAPFLGPGNEATHDGVRYPAWHVRIGMDGSENRRGLHPEIPEAGGCGGGIEAPCWRTRWTTP